MLGRVTFRERAALAAATAACLLGVVVDGGVGHKQRPGHSFHGRRGKNARGSQAETVLEK